MTKPIEPSLAECLEYCQSRGLDRLTYTLGESAKHLSISKKSVYRRIAAGELRVLRFSKRSFAVERLELARLLLMAAS